MRITLQLNTGQTFEGKSFGKELQEDEYGEIVFQTGMVGYPESLTDPSYLNQILVVFSIFGIFSFVRWLVKKSKKIK